MFLNIILTLLVVVLLTITIMLYIWWNKFGKKMFDSISYIKNLLPKYVGLLPINLDINQLFSSLNKINQQFKK
jgi:predicted transcriptional regulator YheO